MRFAAACVCLALACTAPTQALAQVAAVNAQGIFEQTRQAIVQVRVIDKESGSKAGIGSGFLISDTRLVTNFHVISELVFDADKHRATFRREDGIEGPVRVLSIDVVRDLAVLALDQPIPGAMPLAFAESEPVKGETLWSLGNPFDLGLTIVEGTFNGRLAQSLYEKHHFTGSINPGMSGGPTVNRDGAVVGVNVSTAGNQVSFLVPSGFVQALATQTADRADPAALIASAGASLVAHQRLSLEPLLDKALPTRPFGDYQVPAELAAYISCWGGTTDDSERLFTETYLRCSTDDDIYLRGSLSTGSIEYRHELFRTQELGQLRFTRMLNQHMGNNHSYMPASRDDHKAFACKPQRVATGNMHFKLVTCVRAYEALDGIYDLVLLATSLGQAQQALFSELKVTGATLDNVTDLVGAYLTTFGHSQ